MNSFCYQADKDLFEYLRQKDNLALLAKKNLRMSFGRNGKLILEQRKVRWSYYKFFLMPFDSGRIYVNCFNSYEDVAQNKESLLAVVEKLMMKADMRLPQEAFGLLRRLPEGRLQQKKVEKMQSNNTLAPQRNEAFSEDGSIRNVPPIPFGPAPTLSEEFSISSEPDGNTMPDSVPLPEVPPDTSYFSLYSPDTRDVQYVRNLIMQKIRNRPELASLLTPLRSPPAEAVHAVKHEVVSILAYEEWEKAGRSPGRDDEFWSKGEQRFSDAF